MGLILNLSGDSSLYIVDELSRHEMYGSLGHGSSILNLGTGWSSCFMLLPLYFLEENYRYTLDGMLGGLQSRSGRWELDKNPLSVPRIEPRSPSP
jgi:hypothetical protein